MKKILNAITILMIGIAPVHAAQSDHAKISYQDVGSGKAIILIHPFPTDQALWQPQIAGLQKHFRVITLDLKGYGKSEPVDGKAISMSQYADDVNQLMDQLHIQKAVIGGESMGGYVALAFLKSHPDRVNGLVLSDTQSVADSDEARAKREVTAQDILKNGTSGFINAFMPKALSARASEESRTVLKSVMDKQPATAMASALRGMGQREDLSYLLAQTSLPVLIITGSDDAVISPKQSLEMNKIAVNSKLIVVEGAGHLSSLENPGRWNQAVIDYFSH